MNVLKNMVNLYNHAPLDSTYRHALQILLMNLANLKDVTVYDLAELTSASRTTIWRLIKDMGYKNFAEFNAALSSSVSQFSLYNRMDMGKPSSNPQKCLDKIVTYLNKGAEAFSMIDLEKVREIADVLHSNKRISFYWMDVNPYIDALQQNLSMNGKETSIITIVPNMILDAESRDADSVVFIRVLEFTETLNIEPVFITLKNKKSIVILMSNDIDSRYEKYCDYSINKLFKGIASPGNVLCGTYFFALVNEIYRGEYIGDV